MASPLLRNEWYLRNEGELMAEFMPGWITTAERYVDLEGSNMRKYLAERAGSGE